MFDIDRSDTAVGAFWYGVGLPGADSLNAKCPGETRIEDAGSSD